MAGGFRITAAKQALKQDAMDRARARINECPDIHAVENNHQGRGHGALSDAIKERILDLADTIPELEYKQIAELIGVGANTVRTVIVQDDNENAIDFTPISLTHHTQPDYEDYAPAVNEYAGQGLPVRRRELIVVLP